MTVYLLLFLAIFSIGGIFLSKEYTLKANGKFLFAFYTASLIILVEALRDFSVGEDTIHYVDWFKKYVQVNHSINPLHSPIDVDIGYSLLNIVISRFTEDPRALIVVCSILIVGLNIAFMYSVSEDIFFSVLFFFAINFFLTSMVSLRQFIAIPLVSFSYKTLLEKKKIRTLICLAFAYCFHDTSLLFGVLLIACYFLSKSKFSPIKILIFGLITIPISRFVINYAVSKVPFLSFYMSTEKADGNVGKIFYLYTLFDLVIIYLVYLKKEFHTKRMYFLASILAIGIIVTLYSQIIPHMFRFLYYFNYFLIIAVPEMISLSNIKNKGINRIVVIILSVFLFLYYLSVNPGNTVPYKFYF